MSSLSHAASDPSSLAPPQQGGLLRAVGLALVAHALLIAALTWGVNWKSQEAPTVEAEIWSSVRQQAAPRAVEPPPVRPEPEPPKPEREPPQPPKVEPPPTPPAPPKVEPPPDTSVRDAQIALEREKKERERKERELAERREQQKKVEAEKRRQEELAEAKREAQQKAEAQKKLEAQKKAEAQKREAEERKAAEAAEAKRKQQAAAAKAAEEKAAEARRQENIRRMQGLAGASGGATATGSALQSTGPSASYGARVAARVRPNIVFPDSVQGNPSAEVEVRSAPDGTIVGRRLLKSSGNKAWDDAVLRAIDKTETLPRDTDGRVPSLMTISFRPKE